VQRTLKVLGSGIAVGTQVTPRPPGHRGRSPAPGSQRTRHAGGKNPGSMSRVEAADVVVLECPGDGLLTQVPKSAIDATQMGIQRVLAMYRQ
jgi:hypothetical protein